MWIRRSIFATTSLLWLAFASGAAHAAPVAYTDFASFEAALPGAAATLDFDATPAGTAILSGTGLDGITFSYDFGGPLLQVSDGFDTTSAPHFLGTDDGDLLLDGDDFSISFASASAVGMFFLSADPLFDADITLSAGGVSASLSAADLEQTLPDGTDVYFLGLIDAGGAFTSADVATIGGGFFTYNVDDIVTVAAIPEPTSALLMLVGITGLGLSTRRPRAERGAR